MTVQPARADTCSCTHTNTDIHIYVYIHIHTCTHHTFKFGYGREMETCFIHIHFYYYIVSRCSNLLQITFLICVISLRPFLSLLLLLVLLSQPHLPLFCSRVSPRPLQNPPQSGSVLNPDRSLVPRPGKLSRLRLYARSSRCVFRPWMTSSCRTWFRSPPEIPRL